MKLDTEFYRLQLRFDAVRLAAEVAAFTAADWRPHPQGHAGNDAVPLIAHHGDPDDDSVRGRMLPTPQLQRCPYLCQVLASFRSVAGRTRLMRIAGNAEASAHVDTNYYWMQRFRIHVPIITSPGVRFLCGNAQVHMDAGECWVFDTWRAHNVLNPSPDARIHLVVDMVGSAFFWELLGQAERPPLTGPPSVPPLSYVPDRVPELLTEQVNFPVVMSPWEQETLFADVLADLGQAGRATEEVWPFQELLLCFQRDWRDLWSGHGPAASGWPAYRGLLDWFEAQLPAFEGLLLPNGVSAVEAVRQGVVRAALNPELAAEDLFCPKAIVQAGIKQEAARLPLAERGSRFERPVFILAAPRSGSSLLFETLARSPDFVSIGGESHEVFEALPQLDPARRGYDSNRLTAADADAETAAALRRRFLELVRDRDGRPPLPGTVVRLLEKTPKNALRVPFLGAVFPDALFIYLYREPRDNLSSILEAWHSGRFVTYPHLPDWDGLPWSMLLIPRWREYRGKGLPEIAAAQWESTHRHILDDLGKLPRERWCAVSYADLLANPQATAERLCRFAGVAWNQQLQGPLPLSRHTLTPPAPDKWRKNTADLETVLPGVGATDEQVRKVLGLSGTISPGLTADRNGMAAPGSRLAGPRAPNAEALRSVHTSNFPQLLDELGISLVVSTYQAGKLIVVRSQHGRLNTHFREFEAPMGLAVAEGKLAVATRRHVWELRNQPGLSDKLQPPGWHDACYLNRVRYLTGDIRVHEVAYGTDGLWVVNTRFSCLCTVDGVHSFVPRWRPPFVTALAPEDRCHLNGLAMLDGRPKYVTCLGPGDEPEGWRATKASGGLLLDVDSGATVVKGLSMPHSPRWYDGKLWLLESGVGGLARVDLSSGQREQIVELPGFTRGLDFHDSLAFVGLSQVRESNIFGGLAITQRLTEGERSCGVWVVDLNSGQVVAFLRFEAGVQEVFAVQVLAGVRHPEVLPEDEPLLADSFVLPDDALASVVLSGRPLPAR